MVYRSRNRGCFACQQRKVKCDLERPQCSKCKFAGRKCPGYRKSDTPPSPPRSPAHHSSDNDTSSLTLKPRTTDDDTTLTLSATPTSGPVIVDHFLSLFLSDYLPKSHTLIIHNHQHGLSWAQYMPNMSKSLALNQALAAVSLAIVGRANEDERLIKQSFETYGMALGSLRRALMGRERGSEDTLATMMALKTYELWQPTFKSGYGWMTHVQGASVITKGGTMTGAEPPLSTCILRDFRTSSIFDACGRRKACVLGQESWKTDRTAEPQTTELLLDVVVDIPALFEKTDALLHGEAKEPAYTFERIALMQQYSLIHRALDEWYENSEKAMGEPMFWESEEMVGEEEMVFGTRLEFTSLRVAQMVLIYWSCRAMIYGEMDHLESGTSTPTHSPPKSSSPPSTHSPSPAIDSDISLQPPKPSPSTLPNPYHTSALTHADLIVRATPFCVDPAHGMAGVQTVTFPLWTIQHNIYFKRNQPKHDYVYALCRNLGGSRGLFFLSLVTKLTRENYAEMGAKGLTSTMGGDAGLVFMDRERAEGFEYPRAVVEEV